MRINEMAVRAYQTEQAKGFAEEYGNALAFPAKIALVMTELGEAVDAHREGRYRPLERHGIGEEMADAMIRMGALAVAYGIDLDKEIEAKMDRNDGREYRHGKRY